MGAVAEWTRGYGKSTLPGAGNEAVTDSGTKSVKSDPLGIGIFGAIRANSGNTIRDRVCVNRARWRRRRVRIGPKNGVRDRV